jgi:chromosome partitioning protein
MYTLSLANEKGGVAKTTSSVSLGAAIAEMKKRVLLVDLDPLSCLSTSLGLENINGHATIAEALLTDTPIDQAIIRTGVSDLDLIPSKKSLGKAEQHLWQNKQNVYTLKNLLNQLSNFYDYVILDCPPFLGAITLSALLASDMVLIPTQAEYLGIVGMRDLIGKIEKVRTKANPKLIYRSFFTFYNDRNKVNRYLHENMTANFGNVLLQTVIHGDTKIRESQMVGKPVTQYAPNCRAAKQYRLLAQEIQTILCPDDGVADALTEGAGNDQRAD